MRIAVVVGSTRPGRASAKVAKWVEKEATHQGIDTTIVDLADFDLPFLDEEISPQYNPNREPNPEAKKWLDTIAEFDGYVLVTPEYNRSTSAALKNALDYLDYQVTKKPIALVAHGSTGGAQAVAHLRGITGGILAVSVPEVTYVTGMTNSLFDDNGELDADLKAQPYGPQAALKTTLGSLVWYATALKAARENS